MGREVRRVPAGWEHPKNDAGDHIPLFPHDKWRDYEREAAEWEEGQAKWLEGLRKSYAKDGEPWVPIDEEDKHGSYSEYGGSRPQREDFMPKWTAQEATHYQMYEDTTEGTPISPVMASPEELARWLVDNNASAMGGQGASYEGWLRVAQGGYAPSMVMDASGIKSGVDALAGN